MAGKWQAKPLGDCAMLVRDPVTPTENPGVPYIGLEHIGEGTLSLIGQGSAQDVTSTKSRFQKGDILFGKLRPYFRKVVMAPFDGVCSTDIWVARARDETDQRFLFYFMASTEFIETASRASEGTKMPRAQWEYLSRLTRPFPPLEEQRAIAHILSTLDDKIELNRRMNETLEGMARAIFQSWFVDFDAVRAKAAGRQPFGMDAATAALFPASFVDSPLGKIPEGWTATSLPEAIDVNPPRSLTKGREATYLDMANMPTRGHRPTEWVSRPFVSGSRFMNGDTLMARITPCLENGKTAFIDFLRTGEIAWGSTEFIVLRPREPLPPELGYCLARDEDFRDFAIQNMTGSSGRQRVPTDCFEQYMIAVSPGALAASFGTLVGPLFAKARANSEESATLAAMRDALLPKLISGEIRVKDIEGAITEAPE